MALEIERKYLLANDTWKHECDKGILIKQGYLSSVPERTVRVRLKDEKGIITIKGITSGISRIEFEYEIPFEDAIDLMKLCEVPIIEKTRYNIKLNELTWEVDVFEGENKGLILAEVELKNENQLFSLPNWIGQEVSHDSRYYNANLIKHPFKDWNLLS